MMRRVNMLLVFWGVLLTMVGAAWECAHAAKTTTSTAMRIGTHPGGMTRLVLDLSDNLDFTVGHLADPLRVVISSRNLQWKAGTSIGKFPGSVQSIKFETDAAGGRLVIALREPALSKAAFVIPPRDGLGWRFVMDLHQTTRSTFLAAVPAPKAKGKETKPQDIPRDQRQPQPVETANTNGGKSIIITSPVSTAPALDPAPTPPAPVPAASPAPAVPPVTAAPPPSIASAPPSSQGGGQVLVSPMPPPLASAPKSAPTTAHKMPVPDPTPKAIPADGRPVVVIDPGHGGADPGAIGVSGLYEKFVTLAVARDLKSELEKNNRYKVYLTRDRDIFIRLRDRVAIARQFEADLFISLHADSVGNPQLRGLSIYTLSQNASDTESQALADKENKADLIAGVDLSHESPDVANILIDLAQRETMNRSAGFASGIVDEMSRDFTLLSNTHRFAGFAVLKAPDVPSVLVEMGYLSNDAEERQLRQPEFRAKLAKTLARSVDRYFVRDQKARRQ